MTSWALLSAVTRSSSHSRRSRSSSSAAATAADDVAAVLNVSPSQLVASYDVPGIEVAVGQDFRSGDTMDRNAALPDDLQGQTAEQFTCQETAAG